MSAQESSQSVITMPYVPRYPSLHRLLLQRRFVVVVAHRRFGKTTVAINHLLMLAGSCPRPRANCAYIAPLRTQAKAIAWRELKRWSATIPGRVVNESDLFVEFAQSDGTTARVRLFGADNPDALRGQYFDYVVLDEVAQMRPETWEEVVRPTLSDRHGGALFIGTPQGINLFSQLYDFALEQER
ncbi:MAG: DEAD/DEAH box helicase family protein, partial [Desulfovibrio sp.]|nr:DEAD/DEAH box helicase family protein [Desulfovibrio sp.]